MKPILLLAALCFLHNKSFTQYSLAKHYTIYDTRQKKEINIQQLMQLVADDDVLFFGEVHNDSVGHYIENELYRLMVKQYGKVALSMEAFSTDMQPPLNAYLAGAINERAFIQQAQVWWPFYKGYRQLLIKAQKYHLPVIAANAPNRFVEMVGDNGLQSLDTLDTSAKKLLPPLPIAVKRGKDYEDYRAGVINGHSVYFTDSLWQSLVLYNAAMANNIYTFLSARKGFKVLSINGVFHSNNRLGIIPYLHDLDSTYKTGIISCFYAEDYKRPDLNAYEGLADFIIVTDFSVKRTF